VKLFVLSDLHIEFAQFVPDEAAIAAADIVVLAGDIDKGTRGIAWARQAFGSKPVIYVCGNHEFYGHHWTDLLPELRQEADRCDVHLLEDGAVEIGGVQFLGCALWTDFRFFRYLSVTSSMRACERGLNDFRDISADPLPSPQGASGASVPARVRYGKRLTAQHVRVRHRTSLKWLREQLQLANDRGRKPVVITHHLPSERSVSPRFAKDDLTPAFASHLDDLLPLAQLWIHGHTHDSMDYLVQAEGHETRVVCNPRGYPLSPTGTPVFENPSFNSTLLIEI
jgi:hypothetical protein